MERREVKNFKGKGLTIKVFFDINKQGEAVVNKF